MGDTPYSQAQANLLDAMIERMNAEPLAFVVHVGDITSGTGPCGDAWLEARKRQFARLRHPFVLLPGDNEWTDCHRTGFDPLERLARWRSLFCAEVPGLALERQPGEYCENVRWQSGSALFIGVNVPGSYNNLARDPAEHARRMAAVFEWLDESLSLADARGARTIFVLMQADPQFEHGRARDGYARLRAVLATDARRFAGRLVLVHGDTHRYRDDEPLPGLRRIEVPGAPDVRWLRARLADGRLELAPAGP
ncbi:MAG: metallophosphoesterase family protein [Sphingomonadaceae bacterium]